MPDPLESWSSAPAQDAWHSSLVEALRANGFETSPPPIDDDPEPWHDLAPSPAAPAPDPIAEVAPGAAWWADGEALTHEDSAGTSLATFVVEESFETAEPSLAAEPPSTGVPSLLDPADAPVEAVMVRETAMPAERASADAVSADAATADAASADGVAAAAPSAPTGAIAAGPVATRPANAPATHAAATSPSPPAFLAGRIGRVSPVPAATVVVAAATPGDDGTTSPSDVATGPATPDAVDDPRASLEWPEPQPLDDEGWPVTPRHPVTDAAIWPAEDPLSTAAEPRGFAFGGTWDQADAAPAPTSDPWAGVTFSAADTQTSPPGAAVTEPRPDDLDALRMQAAATLAADAAIDPGEPAWPVNDASSAGSDADPTADADPAVDPWTGAMAPDADADPGDTSSPAPDPWRDMPASDATGGASLTVEAWTDAVPPEAAPVTLERIAPDAPMDPIDAAPTATPAVTSGALPLDLDPGRVEFIGYAQVAAASTSPDPSATGTINLPSGTILDVGRRPPGARPVDPNTLTGRTAASATGTAVVGAAAVDVPTVSAAAGTAVVGATAVDAPAARTAAAHPAPIATSAVPSTPGAVGGDLWDLVTAPATPPAPAAAEGKHTSRAATVMLTLAVALVILAIVVGFLYMFTDRF